MIHGQWYIFYHRQTNGTAFSRQGCMEPIRIEEDGTIPQVMITSCGPNGGPLPGEGEYPAYLACNLFCKTENAYTGDPGSFLDSRFPRIMQDGKDGDEEEGYIANMRDGAVAGFKFFDCQGVNRVAVRVRGGCGISCIEVLTAWDGEPCGRIGIRSSNEWKDYEAVIAIPDGVQAIYLRYCGRGYVSLASFSLKK